MITYIEFLSRQLQEIVETYINVQKYSACKFSMNFSGYENKKNLFETKVKILQGEILGLIVNYHGQYFTYTDMLLKYIWMIVDSTKYSATYWGHLILIICTPMIQIMTQARHK